jgi:hypothetical protein
MTDKELLELATAMATKAAGISIDKSTDERQFDGLIYFRGQLWMKCKARKSGVCYVSGNQYSQGDDIYRPIGNSKNRGVRILAKNIVRAAAEIGKTRHG